MDNSRFAPLQPPVPSPASATRDPVSEHDGSGQDQALFAPIVAPIGDDRFAPGSPLLTPSSENGYLPPGGPPSPPRPTSQLPNSGQPLYFPDTQLVDPRRVFAGPGYQAPQVKAHRLPNVALICIFCFFVPGVPLLGAVLAGYAVWDMRKGRYTNHATAVTALALGLVISLGQLLMMLFSAVAMGL